MLILQELTNLAACYAEGYFNLPLGKKHNHIPASSTTHSSIVSLCVIPASLLSYEFVFNLFN